MVLTGLTSRRERGRAPSGDSGSICFVASCTSGGPRPPRSLFKAATTCLVLTSNRSGFSNFSPTFEDAVSTPVPPGSSRTTSLPSGQLTYDLSSIYFLRTSLGVIIPPTTANLVKNQAKSSRVTISSSLSFYHASETPGTSEIHLLVHRQPLNCEVRD